MSDRPFDKPVFLSLGPGRPYQARSVWEAQEYLENYWRGPKTPFYEHAKRVCRAALEGAVGADLARRALLDAAQRVRLLARAPSSGLNGVA